MLSYRDTRQAILCRLNFDRAQGVSEKDLQALTGLNAQEVDTVLSDLENEGVIRWSRLIKEWIIV